MKFIKTKKAIIRLDLVRCIFINRQINDTNLFFIFVDTPDQEITIASGLTEKEAIDVINDLYEQIKEQS